MYYVVTYYHKDIKETDMTKLITNISYELKNKFKARCAALGFSMDSKIRELVEVFLRETEES